MAKKLIDILSDAAVVRDETNEKANTAERVGGVLVELANYLSAFAPVSNVTVEADGANVRLVLHLKNEDGTVSTRSVTLPGATTANAGVLTPELLKALNAADKSNEDLAKEGISKAESASAMLFAEEAARKEADAELLKRIIGKSTFSSAYNDPFKYLKDYQSEKDASGTITKHAIRVMQDALLDTLRHSDYRDSFPYIGHMRAHVEGVPIEMWTYVKAWNTGSTNGVFVQVVRTNFGLKNGVISSALTEGFHEYHRTVTVGMANGSVTDVTATEWQESNADIRAIADEGLSKADAALAQIHEERQERTAADAALEDTIANHTNKLSDLDSKVIYDVSAHNDGAVFESLSALLSSTNLDALIPTSVRHGGMSIRFIQGSVPNSDNKYVQYRLMSDTFNATVANWQGVDDEPTAGSDNLVKSGGVADAVEQIKTEIGFSETITLTTDDESVLCITGTVVSAPPSQSWCGLIIPLQTGIKYDFGTNYDSSTGKGWQIIGICARYPQIGDNVTVLTGNQARSFIPISGQEYALIHIRVSSLPYEYNVSFDGIKKDVTDLQDAVSSLSTELNKNGLTIGGIVKPTDSPADTSGKQVYLCTEKGIYTNFNSEMIPSNGLYYWWLNTTNNHWYKRAIVSHQKCKNENISLIIREMFVIGAKPSDKLYIYSGGSSVENNDVKIVIYKDGQSVSQYWHSGDAKFNEVVEFTENNKSGIKVYAIFDEYTVAQTGGLAYSNGGLTDECYSLDTNGEIAAYLYKDNADKIEKITPKDETVKWTTNNDINTCIAEMYIPNAESLFDDGLYVSRCVVSDTAIRFDLRGFTSDTWIVTCDVDLHKYYFNIKSDGSYRTYFGQGAITPIYKTIDGVLQRIGYIKFNLRNFAMSGARIQVDLNAITNIDNSPSIKKMLSDDRQIILLGDSHFGYPTPNILADVIQGITGIRTFNLGFGGCRMAWRSVDGSNEWDNYSFTNIVDALVSQDFTLQRANVGIGFGYSRQVADLEAIDITKPMQIVLEYGNNDSNNFVDPTPIGDMWQDDSSFDITIPDNVTTKLGTLSRNTFLGAFNYGLLKLYNTFPITLYLQVLSQMWRFLNNADGQRVSVLNYRNGLNLSVGDYNKALQNNCIQLGIRYNDYFNAGIMNYFSLRPASNQDDNIGVGISGSAHLEEVGFAMLAQYLVDKIRNFYSI